MKIIYYLLSISHYATTHTKNRVYIIGGYTGGLSNKRTSTIAEYEDDVWRIAGRLKQARWGHGAVTLKRITIIIGGNPNSGETLVREGQTVLITHGIVFRTKTELWEVGSTETKIMNPTLSDNYCYGIGLFTVETNFCSNN